MRLELEHFIYALRPQRGYDITAHSEGVDKLKSSALLSPLPVDVSEVRRLGEVWSLRAVGREIVASLFTGEERDEFSRVGIYSHNILMSKDDYLKFDLSPMVFMKYFVRDSQKQGILAPLVFDTEDTDFTEETRAVERISSVTLKRIVYFFIKEYPLTLVCKGRNTREMLGIVSFISRLLPESLRVIPFVTAPISKSFRKRFEDVYKMTLIAEKTPFGWGMEEYIDIDKEYDFPRTSDYLVKVAHYLLDEYINHGYIALRREHEALKVKTVEGQGILLQAKDWTVAYEVKNRLVSLEDIEAMAKSENKDGANNYARALLREGQFDPLVDFLKICRVLLTTSSPQALKRDIHLVIDITSAFEVHDRVAVVNIILGQIPDIGTVLLSELQTYPSDDFFSGIMDWSVYPALFSLLIDVDSYDRFESLAIKILKSSLPEHDSFGNNLRYLLDRGRSRFPNRILDFALSFLNAFPQYKAALIKQLKAEDFEPARAALAKSQVPETMAAGYERVSRWPWGFSRRDRERELKSPQEPEPIGRLYTANAEKILRLLKALL